MRRNCIRLKEASQDRHYITILKAHEDTRRRRGNRIRLDSENTVFQGARCKLSTRDAIDIAGSTGVLHFSGCSFPSLTQFLSSTDLNCIERKRKGKRKTSASSIFIF